MNTVLFDKTGTITIGRPELTDVVAVEGLSKNEVLELAASVELSSGHPLADAIVRHARKEGLSLSLPEHVETIAGKGIVAEFPSIAVGNEALAESLGISLSAEEPYLSSESIRLANEGKTVMFVFHDRAPIGLIAVADQPRPESRAVVEALRKMGIDVALVTGDSCSTADAIAHSVGISEVYSEVLPAEKASIVKGIQASGRKIAMVGDGINDAPALAQADVGIAIAAGTDIAMESADIVLMHNNIGDVVSAIHLSREVIKNIKQNLFWAFGYNILGIPIAAGMLYAFGGPLLSPIFAAAAMSLSSVSVVTNALRLKGYKEGMETRSTNSRAI